MPVLKWVKVPVLVLAGSAQPLCGACLFQWCFVIWEVKSCFTLNLVPRSLFCVIFSLGHMLCENHSEYPVGMILKRKRGSTVSLALSLDVMLSLRVAPCCAGGGQRSV